MTQASVARGETKENTIIRGFVVASASTIMSIGAITKPFEIEVTFP